MSNALKYDELDSSIESVISRGESASSGDEDVDALTRLAAGLRGMPNPDFKTKLRAELLPGSRQLTWWPFGRKTRAENEESSRQEQRSGSLIARIIGMPAFSWLK